MKANQPQQDNKTENSMPLGKENLKLMLIGFLIIVLGFILMAGGKSDHPATEFNYDMFSFRRITLAPIVVIAGFVLEIYAIMHKGKR